MVVSAQFRLGGFYTVVTRRLGRRSHAAAAARRWSSSPPACSPRCSPTTSSAWRWRRCWSSCARAGGSTRCRSCWRSPARPNVGSAATLIGNPQNMLIGAGAATLVRRVSAADGRRPGARRARRRLGRDRGWRIAAAGAASDSGRPRSRRRRSTAGRRRRAWRWWRLLMRGLPVRGVAARGAWRWPRAGVLLMSREMASREMLGAGGLAPARAVRRPVRRQRARCSNRVSSASVSWRFARARLDLANPALAVRRHRRCCRTSSRTCRR